MDLFLMRHADAVNGGNSDFSRPLSARGKVQAEKMGDWLKRLSEAPMLLVSSPYIRAHETAALVASSLGPDATMQPDERLASGMSVETGCAVIHELGRGGGRLMLVGHAPDLAVLAAYLIGAKDSGVEMRKGAVAHMETIRAGFGGSILRWLINPTL